jgi:hypothetical protein
MGRYAVSFFLGELVICHVATFFLPDKGCGSISAHPTSFGVVLHLLFESARSDKALNEDAQVRPRTGCVSILVRWLPPR